MNLALGLALLILLPFWLVPGNWRKPLLIASSLVFWAAMSPIGCAWMITMTAVAWGASHTSRVRLVFPAIALMVTVLLTLKATGALSSTSIWVLPLGMSYYLFRCISYMLDVKWGNAKRLPFHDLFLYCAFFPTALAGPVARSAPFTSEVEGLTAASWNHKEIRYGLFLIIAGLLAKMVISGRLERLVHAIYANPEACGAGAALAAVLVFPWQLYFDFGGYTLIALGIGRLLGIRLPPNFNRPFLAPTVTEFWNRWHMSMSGWFRDYVFTPLRFQLRRHRTASIWVASLVTFVLVGVWHGAGWGFIMLGLIHGLATGTENFLGLRSSSVSYVAIARTYLIVAFSLILFQASDLAHAGRVLAAFGRVRVNDLQIVLDTINKLDFGVLLTLVPLFHRITSLGWLDPARGADLLESTSKSRRWLLYAILTSSVLVLAVFEHTPFVYAKF